MDGIISHLQEPLSIKNEILMWQFFDYKKIINADFVCLNWYLSYTLYS